MFITLEGLEGSGKTTQCLMLEDYFKNKGLNVILTKEPAGTNFGQDMRSYISNNSYISNTTKLLSFLACRAQHIQEVILPAMSNMLQIVCDRFVDSTAAYQASTKADIDRIYALHTILFNIMPDVTFFLSIDPQIARARAQHRNNGAHDYFDDACLEEYSRIHNNFAIIAQMFPERLCIIDSAQDPMAVHKAIIKRIKC